MMSYEFDYLPCVCYGSREQGATPYEVPLYGPYLDGRLVGAHILDEVVDQVRRAYEAKHMFMSVGDEIERPFTCAIHAHGDNISWSFRVDQGTYEICYELLVLSLKRRRSFFNVQ